MGIDMQYRGPSFITALPGSIEAYYQGDRRAGRDGYRFRAILCNSYADRHTHDFSSNVTIRDVKPAGIKSMPAFVRIPPPETGRKAERVPR